METKTQQRTSNKTRNPVTSQSRLVQIAWKLKSLKDLTSDVELYFRLREALSTLNTAIDVRRHGLYAAFHHAEISATYILDA